MPQEWFVCRGAKVLGPFTSEQVRQLAVKGSLVPEDLVRTSENQEWQKAATIKGLFGSKPTKSSTPPPLPMPESLVSVTTTTKSTRPPLPEYLSARTPRRSVPKIPPPKSATAKLIVKPKSTTWFMLGVVCLVSFILCCGALSQLPISDLPDRRAASLRIGEVQEAVAKKVIAIVSNTLHIPTSQIMLESRFIEDLKGDSLDVVELVMNIEDAFGISVPDEDYEMIQTVSDAIFYIQGRQGNVNNASTTVTPPSKKSTNPLGITSEGYAAIQDGMTEQAVTSILGSDGEETFSSGSTKGVAFQDASGNAISIVFNNGRVIGKAKLF